MPTAMAAPHSSKADLRAALRARRATQDPALGRELAQRVLEASPFAPGAVVAGFWPLEGEIDVRPLLLALAERGHRLALPEATAPGLPLTFHAWRPDAPLLPGRFRTLHPAPDPVTPDALLVPMLGFDRAGHRLGYGAGYYDRTIAGLPRVWTLGCAYAAQEVERVPAEGHDRPLDGVATEREVFIVGAAA